MRKYLDQFTIQDLKKAAEYYHITYTEEELEIVYQFLLNHSEDLLQQNIQVFEEIRYQISPTLYQRLLELYIDLKQKYL